MQLGMVCEKQTAVSPIASPITWPSLGDAMGELVAGEAKVSSHRIAPTKGSMTQTDFPEATSFLGKIVTAKIDRPLHSRHPEWGFSYLLNYGYLPGALAPDGEDLDVYILNISVPLQQFTGECIAVIHRLNDNDDKLVLVLPGQIVTDQHIQNQTYFQEKYFDSIILRKSNRDLK